MTKEAKYPTRKSVIEALKARTKEGKENYPSALDPENVPLYAAARRFGIELPKKERRERKPTTLKRISKSKRLTKMPSIVPLPPSVKVVEPRIEEVEPLVEEKAREKEQIKLEPVARAKVEAKPSQIRYKIGDLVVNQNPLDSDICGKTGKVVNVSQEEVKVNFREDGGLIRIYEKGFNLDHIARLMPEKRRSQ